MPRCLLLSNGFKKGKHRLHGAGESFDAYLLITTPVLSLRLARSLESCCRNHSCYQRGTVCHTRRIPTRCCTMAEPPATYECFGSFLARLPEEPWGPPIQRPLLKHWMEAADDADPTLPDLQEFITSANWEPQVLREQLTETLQRVVETIYAPIRRSCRRLNALWHVSITFPDIYCGFRKNWDVLWWCRERDFHPEQWDVRKLWEFIILLRDEYHWSYRTCQRLVAREDALKRDKDDDPTLRRYEGLVEQRVQRQLPDGARPVRQSVERPPSPEPLTLSPEPLSPESEQSGFMLQRPTSPSHQQDSAVAGSSSPPSHSPATPRPHYASLATGTDSPPLQPPPSPRPRARTPPPEMIDPQLRI